MVGAAFLAGGWYLQMLTCLDLRGTDRVLRLRIDGAPGQSGSAFYYCPAGDNNVCLPGEKGYIIGVWAGWNSLRDRFVGPKASSFRAAALAFIND